MADSANKDPGASPFGFLSRRTLLRAGLAGGGLALAGGGGALALRGCAPAVQGLRVLSRYQYRVAAALARTIIPAGGPFAIGADRFDLARTLDGYLADAPPQVASDLGTALTLVEYGPLVFDRRLTVFSRLTPAEQAAHFQSWGTSERLLQRQAFIAFRKFFSLVFYDHPEVWPHIGWDGPMA